MMEICGCSWEQQQGAEAGVLDGRKAVQREGAVAREESRLSSLPAVCRTLGRPLESILVSRTSMIAPG